MALAVDVRDLTGATVGSIDLPAEWFEAPVNVHVMHEVVTAQLAAGRRGTHATKNVAAVRGGGRKPWRQKGTGRARHGSIRNPQWTGGGHAHHREPRSYAKRVNRKVRRAALRSALSDRAAAGDVMVVRDLRFDEPRTRDAVAALAALGLDERAVLVVLGERDPATVKSFRNLPAVHTLAVDQLNTHDVLVSDVVVFDETAAELLATGPGAAAGTEEEPA